MKLTKNFSKSEFDCSDGSGMPVEVFSNIQLLTEQLQILRDYTGASIKINSAYRSPLFNLSIGGVSNSQHIIGKASDIVVSGLEPKQVYDTIEWLIERGDMTQGGLGLYKTFVHYDIRGTKARWDFSNK